MTEETQGQFSRPTLTTAKNKKDYINKLIAEGDKRSYNEAMADLELQLWADRFGSNLNKQKRES